jgi:uncharacterized membrane protein (UPF0127 family)
MLTNETRRNILDRVKASGYPGGVSEAFRAAEQGVDVVDQFVKEQQQQQEMQVAQTQQEQENGLRGEHAAGNTQASMTFPDVQPNQSFNTVGMKAPIDIQKVDGQGHLVESYKNVPPGIQDLPTGPSEGTVIESPAAYQKGGLRKLYPDGGFHFNPADFDPNYDQGSVSDNTNNTRFQEDQSNFAEKESTLAKIKSDRKYAETQAQLKAQKGTLVNTTKKNAGIALSNSFLANQLNGGYGGSNMRKSLEANPEKTEEIYKNTMRSSGMNTMRDVALGVTGVGASTKLAAGTNTLGTRILSYPTDKLAGGINSMITKPGVKNFIGSGLKSAYNYGLMTGMPDVIGGVGEAGVNYATGKQSGVSAFKDVALKTSNFVPAIKGFNNLGWVANNYGKIKNFAKGANDFSKGDYLTGITRQFGNSGNEIINYGSKAIKKFIPKSWENSLGIRTATGGQITPPGLNFKEGGVRYSRRKMGYVSKNIL